MILSSKRAADMTLVAACVVQLLTIRDGQPWGDDFAQYITHARNLVELRPYGDIGVLPAGAFLGPREYPPVFPLMLAPVYYLFGPSLPALKVVGIVSLMLALLIFRRLFETTLVGGYLVAWALLVGFHPYLYAFASMVLSDQAFMLWTAVALLALDRWGDTKAPPRTAALRGCIVGMLIALSVETRTIGVALVPALALIALRRRTSWHLTATALATASFLIATTIVLVPEQFQHGARVADMHMVRHAQLYWAYLTSFFPGFTESSAQATLSALRQQAGTQRPRSRRSIRMRVHADRDRIPDSPGRALRDAAAPDSVCLSDRGRRERPTRTPPLGTHCPWDGAARGPASARPRTRVHLRGG